MIRVMVLPFYIKIGIPNSDLVRSSDHPYHPYGSGYCSLYYSYLLHNPFDDVIAVFAGALEPHTSNDSTCKFSECISN